MIRTPSLRPMVAAVSDALAGPILSDLKSEPVRQLTLSILALLDLMSSVLADGDEIAHRSLGQVTEVERGFADLQMTAASNPARVAPAALSPHEQLDWRIARLQDDIADPRVFGRLTELLREKDAATLGWMRRTSSLLLSINSAFEDRFVA